jgi:hypothetical protein
MATHRISGHEVSGWTIGLSVFAGSLMVLSGIFQVFQGFAAIFTDNFFVVGQNYLYKFDATTWGWIHLIIGTIIGYAGISIFSGRAWARGIGILLVIISAIANFFYIPYYPFWSIVIIALDIAVIGALASYNRDAAEGLE